MTGLGRTLGRGIGMVRGATGLIGAPLRGRGAMVLTYHDVTDDPASTSDQVSPQALRADLAALRRWGIELVPLSELVARFEAGRPLDGLAAVTFDDALIGVLREGLGVLDEFGVSATVFAVSQRVGTGVPEWYPGSDRVMTREELLEVVAAGHTVHSHTQTHVDLATVDDADRIRDELTRSRADLEQILGHPVEYLAYPFGHFDRRVRDAAEAAGYRAAFTFQAGRVVAGLDRYRLPRFPMWADHRRARLAFRLGRPQSSFRDTQPESVTA